MWTRKPEIEIDELISQNETKKKNLFRPLYFAIPLSVFVTTLYMLGYRGGLSRGFILYCSPTSILQPKMLILGLLVFAITYSIALYHQRKGTSMFSGNEFLRCLECKELCSKNIKNVCGCGGRLEPSDYFTWDESSI